MRLAIVHDNRAVLEHLKHILAGEATISLVGCYSSGTDALRQLKRISPDAVLASLDLPDMSGTDFIRQVRSKVPGTDVLVYTHCEDQERVFSALHAGASGYLLKGIKPGDLVESLISLHQGGAPLSPRIARMVVTGFHLGNSTNSPGRLTQREKDILSCLGNRMNYKEIARALSISPHTARTHIRNIYEKLQVKNRDEALTKARRSAEI